MAGGSCINLTSSPFPTLLFLSKMKLLLINGAMELKLLIILLAVTLAVVFTAPLCYHHVNSYFSLQDHFYFSSSSQPLPPSPSVNRAVEDGDDDSVSDSVSLGCDAYRGEWVRDENAPYYTNVSCRAIHEHQNCMKHGRPDGEFMKWRWKPDGDGCELPAFDPAQFLEIVSGKSLAFVGDSVGRNQMQSLICLLSRVAYPTDVSTKTDFNFKRWNYPSHNFTIASFWAPYLVKTEQEEETETGRFNLYLDEPNPDWTTQIHEFDYVIINAGHWFYQPSLYYENRRLTGCRFCHLANVPNLPLHYGYRRAFRTAFRAILNSSPSYKGLTILRTFAPSHFENGVWDKGGDCVRTRPFRRGEARRLDVVESEMYRAQMEEFRDAERAGEKKGLRFRVMDATLAMLLRPDGHPGSYGHFPDANVTTMFNDCVHWCLPGPIDTWSDFLLHMLKIEERTYADASDKIVI